MKISVSENGHEEGGKTIMNYQTTEQLIEMRLHSMKYEYQRQSELPAMVELSFDERFSMIVNEQYVAKSNAKVKRLIKYAKLRDESACLENIDYDTARGLKKPLIASLSDCNWVTEGTNLIITGATGVGKTYILSAFGREACIKGYTVKSYRTTRLLTDLNIAKGDGSYNKRMDDLVKPDLLILDDFGMKQLDLTMTQDFLEVIEDRYHQHKSIAISAQLPVKDWPAVFKDATIADAVLDRIVRNAHRINLKGPSRRPVVNALSE